ncbi:MAG: hypothetical protein ACRDNI_03210 [Gaiellaceae bacterium]
MTTTYEGIPELPERLTGADLVLIGRVETLADVEMHTVEEAAETHSLFSIAVERVLEGELDLEHITVRVVGGTAENVETSWTVQLPEGERMLLLLSPDVGPGRPPDAYVPFFAGCYRVTDEVAALPEGRTPLTKIRSLLASKRRARKRELAALEELEPANLRRRPYEPVAEMPEELGRGAEGAKPDDGPKEHKPTGSKSRRGRSSPGG